MSYETTMDMSTDDWEFNCARSWESHILSIDWACQQAILQDDDPYWDKI